MQPDIKASARVRGTYLRRYFGAMHMSTVDCPLAVTLEATRADSHFDRLSQTHHPCAADHGASRPDSIVWAVLRSTRA